MSDSDNISVKIVILGEPAVGKTTLRINFIGKGISDDSANYLMTLGADLSESTIDISDKITLDAQIWDIAGQDNFAPIIGEYLRGAQGAILVFDMTRSYTFDELTKWLDRLHEANPQLDNNIPFLIVGNKADLENFYDYDEEKVNEFVSYVNRHELYSKTPVQHVNTSAKTGYAVQEAFRTLGKTIIRNFLELGEEIDGAEDIFENIEEITGKPAGKEEDTAPPIVDDEEERLVKPSELLRRRQEQEAKEAEKKEKIHHQDPPVTANKSSEKIHYHQPENRDNLKNSDEVKQVETIETISENVTSETTRDEIESTTEEMLKEQSEDENNAMDENLLQDDKDLEVSTFSTSETIQSQSEVNEESKDEYVENTGLSTPSDESIGSTVEVRENEEDEPIPEQTTLTPTSAHSQEDKVQNEITSDHEDNNFKQDQSRVNLQDAVDSPSSSTVQDEGFNEESSKMYEEDEPTETRKQTVEEFQGDNNDEVEQNFLSSQSNNASEQSKTEESEKADEVENDQN